MFIKSTLKQQERDILLTKRLYKDNESENKEDYHKQQINNFKLVNERKSYQVNNDSIKIELKNKVYFALMAQIYCQLHFT